MGTVGKLVAKVRRIELIWIDRAAAVALLVAGLLDAGSQPHSALGAIAIASLVATMGSVAWRRVAPARTTLIAVSGMAVFELASKYHGDGTFEVAALALNFYTFGRHIRPREDIVWGAGLALAWIACAAVTTYVPPGGTVGAMIGGVALAGVLPFAIGVTISRRSALARQLEENLERLRHEHELSARAATAEERNRMARELHDVVAHCLSVMVVQTEAARRVVAATPGAAREALAVVESSGREALVELRRIVGVLRRDEDGSADPTAPGLAQLGALIERTRAAGLPVELEFDGPADVLSPGLDLVAYRIVQEALTNAIKHAGPARAAVSVSIGVEAVELKVTDTGGGPVSVNGADGTGHGLIGMAERVRVYGGELRAGPEPDGGFEVSARIPLAGRTATASAPPDLPPPAIRAAHPDTALRWPWLDPLLACLTLAALEVAVLVSHHRRGPLVLNIVVVAAIATSMVWRRERPLAFLLVVGLLGLVMNARLTELTTSSLVGAYFGLIPPYAVAAWGRRRDALAGLAVYLVGAAISNALAHHSAGAVAGATFTVCAAWAAGRAIRSYRVLTSELERTSASLAAERDYRARLAVAGERSRIARELHTVIARSVEAMVVQAAAAQRTLQADPGRADEAMAAIEQTGRVTLADMRLALGVLRHRGDRERRTPQPGLHQVYRLIELARERGQSVDLTVEGEPGTLAAGVELGLYRILENALQSAEGAVGVALRFGERELELLLTASCHGPNGWPTDTMRERLALCDGELEAEGVGADGWLFSARMPRGIRELVA